MRAEAILGRVEALLALRVTNGDHTSANILFRGTVSLVESVYGSGSMQAQLLAEIGKRPYGTTYGIFQACDDMEHAAKGVLETLRAEIHQGLIGSVERRGAGSSLSDFLALAREALRESDPGAVHVAAVLVAAAFEDTMRRMGESLAGVSGRPDLSAVLGSLKEKGVLEGAPLTTALSYLKFRNDALHADWGRLDRSVIGSCMAFVEAQLLMHFS